MMKKLLLSSVAVAVITLAADGPAKAAPPPAYNWTGCYIGGNIGGGWVDKDFDPRPSVGWPGGSSAPSGFAGGLQLGCDVQSGTWVFGAQGLFDWTSLKGSTPFFAGKGFVTRSPWFASATGRIG